MENVGRLIDVRYNADSWVDKNYDYHLKREILEKIGKGTYFEKGNQGYDIIYTTWATDLLPEEIDLENRFIKRENVINYIGTIGGGKGGIFDCLKAPDYYDTVPYIIPFYEACKENGIYSNMAMLLLKLPFKLWGKVAGGRFNKRLHQ